MIDFLRALSLPLSIISITVALLSIIWSIVQDRFWAKEDRTWKKSARSQKKVYVTKPKGWARQHNAGPDPWSANYPDFQLRDFSDSIALMIRREESV